MQNDPHPRHRINTTQMNQPTTAVPSHATPNLPQTVEITVQGRRLEVVRIPAGKPGMPELVFLHEGLGSVSHWKNFPARVAEATGCPVTIYSRYGNGNSDLLTEARPSPTCTTKPSIPFPIFSSNFT